LFDLLVLLGQDSIGHANSFGLHREANVLVAIQGECGRAMAPSEDYIGIVRETKNLEKQGLEMERGTGIEPAQPAWKQGCQGLRLNHQTAFSKFRQVAGFCPRDNGILALVNLPQS
jgi:hypothetical protein